MYMCRTRIFDKHIARQGKNGERLLQFGFGFIISGEHH